MDNNTNLLSQFGSELNDPMPHDREGHREQPSFLSSSFLDNNAVSDSPHLPTATGDNNYCCSVSKTSTSEFATADNFSGPSSILLQTGYQKEYNELTARYQRWVFDKVRKLK